MPPNGRLPNNPAGSFPARISAEKQRKNALQPLEGTFSSQIFIMNQWLEGLSAAPITAEFFPLKTRLAEELQGTAAEFSPGSAVDPRRAAA
jgi:hypothetical protein